MNCADFEKIAVELARSEVRGVWPEAATQHIGLQHAQSCVRCAGRLKTEQTLSRSLRAVATGDQALSVSASVETALLAAFRAREEAVPLTANVIVPTFHESPLKLFFMRMRWAFAAAVALALIAFAAGIMKQLATSQQKEIVNAPPAPTAAVTPPPPVQVKAPEPQPTPAERPDLIVKTNAPRLPVQVKANAPRPLPVRRNDRVTVDVGPFELDEPETFSAKDFLVFDYAQNLPPADSVQLMRVRMPRERLAPLGIPLPRETRNESFINADFLVGSDGVPRAIRVANR